MRLLPGTVVTVGPLVDRDSGSLYIFLEKKIVSNSNIKCPKKWSLSFSLLGRLNLILERKSKMTLWLESERESAARCRFHLRCITRRVRSVRARFWCWRLVRVSLLSPFRSFVKNYFSKRKKSCSSSAMLATVQQVTKHRALSIRHQLYQ